MRELWCRSKATFPPTGNAVVFSLNENGIEWLEETAKTADEVLGNIFAAVGRPDEQMQAAGVSESMP